MSQINVPAAPAGSPWHTGEVALQRRAGVEKQMDAVGRRVVRSYMPEQHREFFPQLPFAVFGSVDAQGDAWASLLSGGVGFLQSPDPRSLTAEFPRDPADPADAGMGDGQPVGLLGIELHTRRRNRMNGLLSRSGPERFRLDVVESFGNCPQYIQLRQFEATRAPGTPSPEGPQWLPALDERAQALIAGADSFYVASYVDLEDGQRKVDVSHRGGRPGFVRQNADGSLTIPDFAGNLFFNTLGNILLNGKAGLVFVDFERGDLLQLSGDAEVLLDSPETAAFQGAERLWRFIPRRMVYRPQALSLRWAKQPAGASPNSLLTGNWEQAAERLHAAELSRQWRPFEVVEIIDESSTIRSFELAPADGVGLIPHLAGQHLPLRVQLPGQEQPVQRSYTLSVAPSDNRYRISVKRDGLVSKYLHDMVRRGDRIEVRAPAGGFTLDATQRRPAVLLAAGVGITPMLSFVRHIAYEGARKRRVRPTWLFQSSRTLAERAFDAEIGGLVGRTQGAIRHIRVLSQPGNAVPGEDYDAEGHIDVNLLRAVLPFDDYDFYLCGPAGFMQSVYDGLRELNVADARIHAEAFGPSSLQRKPDEGAPSKPLLPPATVPVPVVFADSAKEARWQPGEGSLLELAEQRGLAPAFSCRSGSCGSCRTRVLEGEVSYAAQPSAEVGEGEALVCCAIPAAGSQRVVLAL
ncbi:pyridoxamine 5'-phosphate oxidase family protein [Chitinimonas sp.]|uniref:2Fe-2S iron-sulfur cluster-binding protein n=1 Tax=Chitinimonas sp. TaxID=1934313 RepID=UPI002F91F139